MMSENISEKRFLFPNFVMQVPIVLAYFPYLQSVGKVYGSSNVAPARGMCKLFAKFSSTVDSFHLGSMMFCSKFDLIKIQQNIHPTASKRMTSSRV